MLFNNKGNDYYRAFMTIKYGCLFVKDLDAPYKEGRIAKTQDMATHKMKCYKTGKNKTGFQAVKRNGKLYQYFYGVQVLWDGYDLAKSREENDEENYDYFELFDADFYDIVLNYYKENPYDKLKIIELDKNSTEEPDEAVLPADQKEIIFKNAVYIGKKKDSGNDVDVADSDDDGSDSEESDEE